MVRAFKFMPKKYISDFLGGRIKLGTLDYFRNMEGPQWIADKHEGLAHGTIKNFVFRKDHPQTEEHRRRLLETGVLIGNADEVTFTNSKVIIEATPVYVFCASLEPFEKAKKAMCEDAPPEYRYDGCVEISDLALFAKELGSGKLDDGTDFASVAGRYVGGNVKYEKRELSFEDGDRMRIDPFLKHKRFEYQQEFRILFQPRGRVVGETFFVNMSPPLPGGLMREIKM